MALKGKALVHCTQGVSRSPALCIAYLMWKQCLTYEDAFSRVKDCRGIVNPNLGFVCQVSVLFTPLPQRKWNRYCSSQFGCRNGHIAENASTKRRFGHPSFAWSQQRELSDYLKLFLFMIIISNQLTNNKSDKYLWLQLKEWHASCLLPHRQAFQIDRNEHRLFAILEAPNLKDPISIYVLKLATRIYTWKVSLLAPSLSDIASCMIQVTVLQSQESSFRFSFACLEHSAILQWGREACCCLARIAHYCDLIDQQVPQMDCLKRLILLHLVSIVWLFYKLRIG